MRAMLSPHFISSNSWSMPPPAPGPVWRLELSMLESGERLLLSGLLACVSRSPVSNYYLTAKAWTF